MGTRQERSCLGYLHTEADSDCSFLSSRILWRKTNGVAFGTQLQVERTVATDTSQLSIKYVNF